MSKDKQVKSDATLTGIPLLSPLLHCLAMPVVVFLRFNFGYAYLSPKFIFLPIIFTGSVASFVAWTFPSTKDFARGIIGFHLVASILYLVHLAVAHGSVWARNSEHNQFSGSSYLLALAPPDRRDGLEPWAHRLMEPLIVGAVGTFAGGLLGTFLLIAAVSLAVKEWINAWFTIWLEKVTDDALEDAEARMDSRRQDEQKPISGRGRVDEPDRKRNSEE